MPNWSHNILTITGDLQELETCFQLIGNKFDFNKIIPMPEVVKKTEAGCIEEYGLIVLGEKCGQEFLEYNWIKQDGVANTEELKAYFLKEHPECVEIAQRSIAAKRETGYYNWYDWSCANWGTKWNAHVFSSKKIGETKVEVDFDTAYSPPFPIIEKLSEMFPFLVFEINFAEDQGGYDGVVKFEYGHCSMSDVGNPLADWIENERTGWVLED